MIAFDSETIVTLTEAAKRIPRRRGRATAVSTLFRWATRGVRGTKLETIRIGGSTCTSIEALQRFFEALTPAVQQTVVEVKSKVGDVEARLDQLGL